MLDNKSKKLFDTLSRNWKMPKKPVDSKEKDVHKETIQFCKNVGIARTRKYNIHKLLPFEMCETSFFLTKDGYISKTNTGFPLVINRFQQFFINWFITNNNKMQSSLTSRWS